MMEYTWEHYDFDNKLEQFVARPKMPPVQEQARMARQFLRVNGLPDNVPSFLLAMQSLRTVYESEHKA